LNRFSLKQACLTIIRLPFWVNWLLACLCLTTITGCAFRATPETWDLRYYEDGTLPNLTLARRVVPEVGYEEREFYGSLDIVQVESESRFGSPDEKPDLSCIYTGLREALPSIDIIPTATFWEQIDAAQDAVELTELFTAPQSNWLRALQADVLVIAYHARIDLRYVMMEAVVEGSYDDIDRETATIVVVDLNRKTIIHGSSISFEDRDGFAHALIIVPMIMSSREPFDICNKVARQAGTAIIEAMPDRAIRALVVVAAENPVLAADDRYEAGVWQNNDSFDPLQEEEVLLWQAQQGNADAQLALFKHLRKIQPGAALAWICKSADLGNQEARVILGNIFQHGVYFWIEEGIVERNYKRAYVWYALSGQYDQEDLIFFADRYLTPKRQIEAKKALEDWQPGNCERELGLVSYTE